MSSSSHSRRRDGALGDATTIWVVRLVDDLYVRSVNGRAGAWFRGTRTRHQGRIRSAGVEKDVTFVDADSDLDDAIDNAYRTKYRRYGANIVDTVLTPEARSATIKLLPRSASPNSMATVGHGDTRGFVHKGLSTEE